MTKRRKMFPWLVKDIFENINKQGLIAYINCDLLIASLPNDILRKSVIYKYAVMRFCK